MSSCSIHSHFEVLDTANALPNPGHKNIPDLLRALKAYKDAGYTHVAVTEHGSFCSYEDLRALSKEAGITIIPAIEGYVQTEGFRGNADDPLYQSSHVILIAKDEAGYRSLVKIINHSEYNTSKMRMEIPLRVLREDTEKGHLICSSACVAGILGVPLIAESRRQESYEKAAETLEKFNYLPLLQKKEEEERLKQTARQTYKQKKKNAEKKLELFRGTSDEAKFQQELEEWNRVEQEVLAAKEELETRKEEFAENEKKIKAANKHQCKSKYEEVSSYQPVTMEERAHNREKLDEIFQTFTEIFGGDFYIELQNHQMETERSIYNTIVTYCESKRAEGFTPKYIQSNDTHICCRPDDANTEKMIQARNVMKLVRMKIYDEFNAADSEYCIKTEEEISARLKELQGTYFDLLTGTETSSLITDELIAESAKNTHILESINAAPKKADHYPAVPDADAIFEQKLAEGIQNRFHCTLEELPDNYRERILYEKEIMKKMNVIPYHIIVQEFITFANYYGRIPKHRRAEVEEFLDDTDKIVAFVEQNKFPPAIATGYGRGSAAGSLVCYCLGITGLDPIVFGLSMERYLNPERVSMPDIDTDLSKDVREAVIRHCEKKYGYVCRIGTKTYCALRSAISKAVDYLAKKHYKDDNIEITEKISFEDYKKRWLAIGKEFKNQFLSGNDFIENDDLTDEEKEQLEEQERADFAQKLVGAKLTSEQQEICDYYPYAMGQFTQIGQHACGMIISKDRLDDALPMYYSATKGSWQTQMTYPQAEDLGYLKMDMLGLITLDICNEIEQQTGDFPDLETILNDPAVYEIMRSGKTEGIFQMNGKRVAIHMQKDLRPTCIEDIIGENALNRPGPWDAFHEDYAKRKHDKNYKGENSIDTSYSEALTKILEPTYGCLLYQEQVMEIFRQLAGYSMGAADNVRRAMGKKKMEIIEAEKSRFIYGTEGWVYQVDYTDQNDKPKSFQFTISAETKEDARKEIEALWKKNRFADYAKDIKKLNTITLKDAYIPGCQRNGIPVQKAEQLFDIMAEFAKYAFNKSHAAAYAVIACRTAYHKAKHPAVFYAATLNHQDDPKKAKNILKEVAAADVELEPPKLSNFSYAFRGNEKENKVIFGVRGIKGFGDALTNVQFRPAGNLYEFCVMNPEIPKDNLESLIKVGFFDEWGYTRQGLLKVLPACLKEAAAQTQNETLDFYEEKVYPILKENLLVMQSSEESFENLQWENELMGIGLSLKNGIKILKTHRNTKPYTGECEWCNFAVAACSEAKTTKNGHVYYEATLVDVDGNFVTRRFSQPVASACVRVWVNAEDQRYFITDCENYPVKPLTRVQYSVDEANIPTAMLPLFQETPDDAHSAELVFDGSGKTVYVRPKIFAELEKRYLIYETSFQKVLAAPIASSL